MPNIKYLPKSATQQFGLAIAYPSDYNPSHRYMTWLIGHGAGETGNGSITALQKVVGWGGFEQLLLAVDQHKFIAVFLNTATNYSTKEYQFAKEYVKANLPYKRGAIWVLGHSLGSYGAGNYAFTDPSFTDSDIAGWFISSTGGFVQRTILYDNIIRNNIRIWGVTAENDAVVPYTYVTRVQDTILSRDSSYPVIMTVFPSTTWPNGITAHNATVGRLLALSATQLIYSGTRGKIPSNVSGFKMNRYQWAESNPRGSIYQPPTNAFVGPIFPDNQEDTTTTTTTTTSTTKMAQTYTRIGINISDPDPLTNTMIVEVIWAGAAKDIYTVRNIYFSDKSDRFDFTLLTGRIISVFKTKTV